MRIAVCDDQFKERKQLYALLESYFNRSALNAHIDSFGSAEDFLASFQGGKYQIVFLDIYMPGLSGITLAKRIRECDRTCALIFTTCSPDHAMESYAFYTAGYLLKPYTGRELEEVLDWCMTHPSANLPTVSISCRHERMTFLAADISYIESFGRECSFHTEDGLFTANKSLSELEKTLPPSFLRCHKSYIVNMDHVARIEGNGFITAQGASVSISFENASAIKQSYFDYMYKKAWGGK